ncbi:MAG TPA: acyl carrier protein [Tepidisphaeraceae bacterium]|jgi:acyl carrier protein|nr:acyl carrier protein [Tepidisphaeraceae bacterium]
MTNPSSPSSDEIQRWLIAKLAKLLKVEPQKIDATQSFDRLGLDSATAVGVTLDLEDFLGRDVDPEVLYDHPTIEKLAAYLVGGTGQTDAPDRASGTGGS